jgi:hypothetical protein
LVGTTTSLAVKRFACISFCGQILIDTRNGEGKMKRARKMSKPHSHWLLYFAFYILSMFLLFGCGSSGGSGSEASASNGTGGIAFNLLLKGVEESESGFMAAAQIDCFDAGIKTVEGEVYDANGILLATGGPWYCEIGEGTIDDVEAGAGRTVWAIARGEGDSPGSVDDPILYMGKSEPIEVVPDQTTNAGTIELLPVFLPEPPANLNASDGTFVGRIRLTWSDVDSENGYRIYRSLNAGGPFSEIDQTDVNVTSYDDFFDLQSCDPDQVYWYIVKAFNNAGESGDSNIESGFADCPIDPPEPPANLNASDGTFADRIRLTWSDVDSEDGYRIYRSLNAGGPFSEIDQTDVNVTSYDDFRSCDDEQVYWYIVTAFNSAGESGDSNTDSGVTADCPIFAFDTNNQGWRLVGLYDDGGLNEIPGDCNGNPCFSDVPAPWLESSGSESSRIGAGPGDRLTMPPSPTGDAFLHWDLNSPDLSLDNRWQRLKALKYDVKGGTLSSTGGSNDVYVQTVLHVKKPDGSESFFTDRVFHNIPLGKPNELNWATHTLNIETLNMPEGTIILDINFRVFLLAEEVFDGYIWIDNVTGLD